MEPDTKMPARKPPDPMDALKAAKDLARAEHPAPGDKVPDALAGLKAAKEWAKADRPALAGKAHDLEALRTSVVDAATVGGGIWFSYLFVLFYLLISVGGVTHKDLLLESPVRLPFMNVDLPLKGFFWLGPLLFLIVHLYVLVHFDVLAGKIRAFDEQLTLQLRGEDDIRARLRRQLPSNIFVQLLAGPRDKRGWSKTGTMFWIMAAVTLVLGPVFLLIFFFLQFLPYQHQGIAHWQRAAVGIDLIFIWMFWRDIAVRHPADGADPATSHWSRRLGRVLAAEGLMGTLTLGAAVLLLGIAAFPGDRLDIWPRGEEAIAAAPPVPRFFARARVALFEGDADNVTRRPSSFLANRLVLPGLDVIDHVKLDEAKIVALSETVLLRGRSLRNAVLIGAGLRKADLSGAILDGADLRQANLRGARLEEKASMQGANLVGASMQGANLEGASMQGANLVRASMQWAYLGGASMQGAYLESAYGWRANPSVSERTYAYTKNLTFARVHSCSDRANTRCPPWTHETFVALRAEAASAIPEGWARDAALARIDATLDPDKPLDGQAAQDKAWEAWLAVPVTPDQADAERAGQLGRPGAACAETGAPYAVAALIRRMAVDGGNFLTTPLFANNTPHRATLTKSFLDPACAGARGLADEDLALLKTWASEATTAPSPR